MGFGVTSANQSNVNIMSPVATATHLCSQCSHSIDLKTHCLFCGLETKDAKKLSGLKREHNFTKPSINVGHYHLVNKILFSMISQTFVPALFDDVSMLKTPKGSLYHFLDMNSNLVDALVIGPTPVVIDGATFYTPLYEIHTVHIQM
jgi:hypothetical protein